MVVYCRFPWRECTTRPLFHSRQLPSFARQTAECGCPHVGLDEDVRRYTGVRLSTAAAGLGGEFSNGDVPIATDRDSGG